jgi:hypothetical protein
LVIIKDVANRVIDSEHGSLYQVMVVTAHWQTSEVDITATIASFTMPKFVQVKPDIEGCSTSEVNVV